VTAVATVLRGVHAAWDARESDLVRIEAAHATLRHVVRLARQAQSVNGITTADNTTGSLSLLMPSGSTYVWQRDAATDEVRFGTGSATDLLAEGITGFRLVGYESDGTTPTTVLFNIHAILCEVTVTLQRDTNPTRTISCRAWLRSF